MDTHRHPMGNDAGERRGCWLTGCIQFNMIHSSGFRIVTEKRSDALRNCFGIVVHDLGSSLAFLSLHIDGDERAVAEVLPPGAPDRREDEQIILVLTDIAYRERIVLATFS